MRVTVKNESHIFRSTSQRTNESVYFVNLEDDITLTLAKRANGICPTACHSKGETNHGITAQSHVELTKTLP